jgi:hypothetical protein
MFSAAKRIGYDTNYEKDSDGGTQPGGGAGQLGGGLNR